MRTLAVAVVATLLAAVGWAGILPTAMTGRVTSGGAPVEGFTVTVSSPGLHQARTTATGASGRWWLDALPPGRYHVTFEREGFQTLTRQAVVELARVTRVDAVVEPSEDEETVTSSAVTLTVAETQPITTHFADAAIDRLPVRREPAELARLAPLFFGATFTVLTDGVTTPVPIWLGQEVIEEVTVVRGAVPVESTAAWGTATLVRTRHPTRRLFLSLRDTMTNESWNGGRSAYGPSEGVEHFLEATASGPLLRDRLWLLAAVWDGDDVNRLGRHREGQAAKASAQIGLRHHVVVSHLAGSTAARDVRVSSLEYSALAAPDLSVQALLSRSERTDSLFFRSTYLTSGLGLGDHLLTVGGSASSLELPSGSDRRSTALFIDDRWMLDRWIVHLGGRYDRDSRRERLSPRLSIAHDLRGDGRRALIATYSEYAAPEMREATLGFASAIGASGRLRLDLVRQEETHVSVSGAMAEATYRMFDRFEIGANGSMANTTAGDDRRGNAWINAAFTVGENLLGVTVLERYVRAGASAHILTTDLALRYDVKVMNLVLTAAADVANVLDQRGALREIRGWLRLRL